MQGLIFGASAGAVRWEILGDSIVILSKNGSRDGPRRFSVKHHRGATNWSSNVEPDVKYSEVNDTVVILIRFQLIGDAFRFVLLKYLNTSLWFTLKLLKPLVMIPTRYPIYSNI